MAKYFSRDFWNCSSIRTVSKQRCNVCVKMMMCCACLWINFAGVIFEIIYKLWATGGDAVWWRDDAFRWWCRTSENYVFLVRAITTNLPPEADIRHSWQWTCNVRWLACDQHVSIVWFYDYLHVNFDNVGKEFRVTHCLPTDTGTEGPSRSSSRSHEI